MKRLAKMGSLWGDLALHLDLVSPLDNNAK